MAKRDEEDLQPADVRILRVLRLRRAEYPSLIASQTGLHFSLVDRHCKRLTRRGYVEPVSGEVLYRITSRGEQCLERL